MHKILKCLLIGSCSLLLPLQIKAFVLESSHADTQWLGKYWYEGSAGRTVGGSAIVEEITLEIGANGECRIVEEGYQLDNEIKCRIETNRNELNVKFDTLASSHGVRGEKYHSGDVLFSLIRKKSGTSLLTRWSSMTPYGVKSKTGIYFRRL